MNGVKLRFPGFRKRAVTLSYDDGCTDDRKLIEIMGKYGLKGTFNIPSGFLGVRGKHDHVTAEEVRSLYLEGGHEIALHGRHHLKLTEQRFAAAREDIRADKEFWEDLLGTEVDGMAYAYGAYSDEIVDMVQHLGIRYARGTRTTNGFSLPEDLLRIPATAYHLQANLKELTEEFLSPIEDGESRLFYLYGHSYELGDSDAWDIIENFGKKLGNREDIWYATGGEIFRYIEAYQGLKFDGASVQNPTKEDIFLEYRQREYLVRAGEQISLDG